MLLLLGVLLSVPASPSDAPVVDRPPSTMLLGDDAPRTALGVPPPHTPELAPASAVTLAQLTLLPKLSSSWQALVVALVAWGCIRAARVHVEPSRFPPGRRGRALLHAYLN